MSFSVKGTAGDQANAAQVQKPAKKSPEAQVDSSGKKPGAEPRDEAAILSVSNLEQGVSDTAVARKVDSELSRDSARAAAEQVRQQLAGQNQPIANRNPAALRELLEA
ncbi:MAG: hypothetical protein EP335_00700 [Alphaproteobacteria bacterium]|nr:MAG: hypothetical protein EP335_00700 [Alphaproteobacteria bacterium]